jgi:hypothetical protein
MILAAINLALVTLLFFIIGMIKPRWALFFLDKPDRLIVLSVTAFLVMASITMYGEGHRREVLITKKTDKTVKIAPDPVPVPKPKAETTKK